MKSFIAVAALLAVGLFAASAEAQCHSRGFSSNTVVFQQPFVQQVGFGGFPSRTITDQNGNVFEVDQFGRVAFRGNVFGSQFASFNSPPVAFASPTVVQQNTFVRRGLFGNVRRVNARTVVSAPGVFVSVR